MSAVPLDEAGGGKRHGEPLPHEGQLKSTRKIVTVFRKYNINAYEDDDIQKGRNPSVGRTLCV